MTILSERKRSSSRIIAESDDDDDDIVAPPHLQSYHTPNEQLQSDSGNSVFGGERLSSSALWSHGQSSLPNLMYTHNSTREQVLSSQLYYDEYVGGGNNGKRGHPLSPSGATSSKIKREEPDSSTSISSIVVEKSSTCMDKSSSADADAYNSEDEYKSTSQLTVEEWAERDKRFEMKMRKLGLIIKEMGEDGACLFRAVADQVCGDQEMHATIRNQCMDYIVANADYFSQYITEDFDQYVRRKRLDHAHGNHIEIQAMSEMYNRTIEVFCYTSKPMYSFQGTHQTDNAPIRLSYHRGAHYNSLVDPTKATIEVGRGLPSLVPVPSMVDKDILKEGVRRSEEYQIEQAMLVDKLHATDWEATNKEIEEQVATESYLQWLKDKERRDRRSPVASSSSAMETLGTGTSSSSESRSFHLRSNNSKSPTRDKSSFQTLLMKLPSSLPLNSSKNVTNSQSTLASNQPFEIELGTAAVPEEVSEQTAELPETASVLREMPPEIFGLNEWEDADILANVLAISQQEYLDSLKQDRSKK